MTKSSGCSTRRWSINSASCPRREDADLRTVYDDTLVKIEPVNTVTLAMNHDTQP